MEMQSLQNDGEARLWLSSERRSLVMASTSKECENPFSYSAYVPTTNEKFSHDDTKHDSRPPPVDKIAKATGLRMTCILPQIATLARRLTCSQSSQ